MFIYEETAYSCAVQLVKFMSIFERMADEKVQ